MLPRAKKWENQNGANISQLFFRASAFFLNHSQQPLQVSAKNRLAHASLGQKMGAWMAHLRPRERHPNQLRSLRNGASGGCVSKLHGKHALTNFFDLSNIRFVSWGAGEMCGASQCNRFLQFDGPPALAADAALARDFSAHFQFQFQEFSFPYGALAERRALFSHHAPALTKNC